MKDRQNKDIDTLDRRVNVAPMMGWTDRHQRYFMRQITPNALLYTVMITTGALVYGKKLHLLDFNPEEHPVALQLGGSDPGDLAVSARYGAQAGYDEINLNCGCPSDRVQNGNFGACLMAHPQLVADCYDAMQQATPDIPVTIKTRIGIDEQDSYDFLRDFVGTIAERGCCVFIIHARKAWLSGLSPAQNRSVPPLDYARVVKLKQDFPDLRLILNGGLQDIETIKQYCKDLDGVMIGRAAYQDPWFMNALEQEIYKTDHRRTREEIIEAMIPYIEREQTKGTPLKDMTRHMLGLYKGQPRARLWRRFLSEEAYKDHANADVVRLAMNMTLKESA